jgi:hypothetical protein
MYDIVVDIFFSFFVMFSFSWKGRGLPPDSRQSIYPPTRCSPKQLIRFVREYQEPYIFRSVK